MEAVANYDELLTKPGLEGTEVWDAAKKANPKLADDLKVHKPYIDEVTYDSPFETGARMKRVSPKSSTAGTTAARCRLPNGDTRESRPAGSGQPAVEKSSASRQPPSRHAKSSTNNSPPTSSAKPSIKPAAGFTANWRSARCCFRPKADDSRPWALRIPHPFKNCIVLGLMLGEDGQKMSKSKRNYREPGEIFDKYGADALRWYFFATQPPWTTIRYSERAIRDSIPEFLLRLWHTYSFFVIYANIDGFDPLTEI